MKNAKLAPALGLLALLLFSSPANTQTSRSEAEVESLYAEALAARRSGDIAGAIQMYLAIVKLQPKLAAAHNNLGLLYLQTSNYPAAVNAFEEGLRADPKMTAALVPLGTAHFQL